MSRVSLFSAPFLVGFDAFEERFDRLSRASESYPPYNIERIGGTTQGYLVSIAVAGFTADDLEVTVEDNQLLVRGRIRDQADKPYLHRGIAARQFVRSFLLADGMIVRDATLSHGLLVVSIDRPSPERRARRIEIVTR